VLTAVLPVLSYALAAIVYVCFLAGTFQVHPYGAETSVQSSLPFTENSTLETALLSEAAAVIVTVLLWETVPPSRGEVTATNVLH
jgi:NADH:ubiquinone oxidoreductase subunit 6 (subunit J)